MGNHVVFNETQANVLGVDGFMHNRVFNSHTGLYVSQTFTATRPFNAPYYAKGTTITVELRFDDQCRNGYQDFAITASIKEPRTRDVSACGCLHDDIATAFPELAHLIKWHLTGTNGPMHYVANTCYLAGNRDYNGHTAGEPDRFDYGVRFGNSPMTHTIGERFYFWLQNALNDQHGYSFTLLEIAHPRDTKTYRPHYTYEGYSLEWHHCPFRNKTEAEEFTKALQLPVEFVCIPTGFSKGKARELEAARRAAVWPEATDAELCQEHDELKKALTDRLPGLIAAFKADMQAIGFEWAEQ